MAGRIIYVVGEDRSWSPARIRLNDWATDLEQQLGRAVLAKGDDSVLGLHLSPAGVTELEDPEVRSELMDFLDRTRLRIHAAEIDTKRLPGWDRPERAARAIALAELLADLNPQRTELLLSSSLRLPGGVHHPDAKRAAAYLLRFAAFCHDMHVQTRRQVRLCLRNAPTITKDIFQETQGFIDRLLRDAEAERTLAGLAAISREVAGAFLRDFFFVAGRLPSKEHGYPDITVWLGMAPIRLLEVGTREARLVRIIVRKLCRRAPEYSADVWATNVETPYTYPTDDPPEPPELPPAGAMALEVPRCA